VLERCYSLASAPGCDSVHKVTVKRVAGGPVSTYLNRQLKVGDRLEVKGPEGRFVLDASPGPLLLFAGGSGITPIVSILKTALATTARKVTLLYANRTVSAIIFRAELDRLQQAHAGRLRIVHRLDDAEGVVDGAAVQRVVSGQRDASVFVCGPAPFMGLVERTAVVAGASPDRLRIERFTLSTASSALAGQAKGGAASKAPVAAPAAQAPVADGVPEWIDVELRGSRVKVPYKKGQTLLQAARDGGVDAPYSCEEGFCGTCASDLLEGRVVMAADDALTDGEKKKGMILACQSRPLTTRCAFRFCDS
jgi:3-ketosteroid 9alpha-monooxygenase subunit B